MDELNRIDDEDETDAQAIGRWLGFWAEFFVLGLLAVLGAYVAGQWGGPGDYICGLLLALGSIVLAFMRLKARFDGGAGAWRRYLFVDTMSNLWIVLPLFSVIALAGLFLAARWEYGSLHNGGIALFVVSGLAIFLHLKRVFDRIDGHW